MQERLQGFWREWRGFFIFVFFMVPFRSAIADYYLVPTGSMKPTILEGDYVLTDKLAYQTRIPFTETVVAHWGTPQRGDIVVFDSPKDGQRLVKRLVGLPGDRVAMVGNHLYINGAPLGYEARDQAAAANWPAGEQPLLVTEHLGGVDHAIAVQADNGYRYNTFGPYTIPEGHYFMLGDNRDNSGDSRFFGPVPSNLLVGRARYILLSLDWGGSYLPRGGRGLTRLQ